MQVDETGIIRLTPVKLQTADKVKLIAIGLLHSAYVTEDNSLYAFGLNRNCVISPLNQTFLRQHLKLDTSKLAGDSIIELEAGAVKTVVLTASGRIFEWGRTFHIGGTCVTASERVTPSPVKLIDFNNLLLVAITVNNQVFVQGPINDRIFQWENFELGDAKGENITRVTTGGNHILFASEKHDIYAVGTNDARQLGSSGSTDSLDNITLAYALKQKLSTINLQTIEYIVAGDSNSFIVYTEKQD